MTPMVDVVFLLLIFFMISTTFIEAPGIDVDLPQSTSQTTSREPKELRVYVDRQGGVTVADRRVAIDDLEQVLKEQRGSGPSPTFMLLADRQVQHGLVVRIMDAAQAAGYSRLAIGTEPLGDQRR